MTSLRSLEMNDLPDDFDSPGELLNHLWNRLESATRDRASGFHVATLCTLGLDGSPSARSVILRDVDPAARILSFHTDRRSPKVAELSRDGRSTLLCWDSTSKTQLRMAGQARVHVDDEQTRSVIAGSHPKALTVYRNVLVPSTPIASPHDATQASQPLLENVAVVRVEVTSLEWLWLDESGHRRCRFTFDQDVASHQWIVP